MIKVRVRKSDAAAQAIMALASGILLAQAPSSLAAEAASPDAKIITVQRTCRNSVIRVTGFLVARAETGASLETPGYRVAEILVSPGNSVELGQELLRATRDGENSTSLRAPIKGVVTVVNARVGDVTGQPAQKSPEGSSRDEPQFRLAVNGDLDLYVDVPSVYAVRFTKGLSVAIPQDGRQPIHGAVREPVAVVDPASQLGHARISLEPNTDLKAGQFASADVRLDDICALTLPASAVRFNGEQALVKVVTNSGVIDRQLRVSARDGGRVEVLEGLQAGDRVLPARNEIMN